MRQRSVNAARWFGLIMIVLIGAWDMDAMRPHIAAHSWGTLAFVSLFLIVHVSDYLTVGQLVNRIDPLVFQAAAGMVLHSEVHATQQVDLSEILPDAQASRRGWRRFIPLPQPHPSLLSGPATAKLYTFTTVTTTAAQVSGAPYPVTRTGFVVEPE